MLPFNNIFVQPYTLELINATAEGKDGSAMANQFEDIITRVEFKYNCVIINFMTDCDGGAKKGRKELKIRRPWL